jgi:ABC-2 type transport system ATP-binding protein
MAESEKQGGRMEIIQTQGLTRRFRVKREIVEAVRGVDITVRAGEIVALLGPNGAGKTTTLRMLTTLLAPSAGTAVVAGCDVRRDPAAVRRRIGYIGQGNGGSWAQRVRDELLTQGRCYGLSRAEAGRRADELLVALELEAMAKRAISTLSGGQRRRLDVALGLVHRPALLFLDEPSAGLDPHHRANLWEHIRRLHAEHNTTIVLTTHYLDEADIMAERVLIVDHGKVIADDTPARLKASLAGDRILLTLCDEAAAGHAAELAGRIPRVHSLTPDACAVELQVSDGPALLPELLRSLEVAGIHVAAAELRRPTLDDVFLALTGRSLRESDS